MSGEQYLAFYEEVTRGVAPAVPAMHFLQLVKGWPQFKPKDAPRAEFAGASNAMGDRSVYRQESQYTWSPEFLYRPGVETGKMLKHALGYAGPRAIGDGNARIGMLYPVVMPYGDGMPLANSALGLVPNLDEGGVTRSRVFGGCHFKSVSFAFKGTDEVKISFEGMGAGGWVAPDDGPQTPNPVMPDIDPFNSCEVKYYIGPGALRTGTAPDFTSIEPGTMTQFFPESLNLKISNGIDDKVVGNGVRGPSKPYRANKFGVEVDLTVDYEDPASGFSSAEEYKSLFCAPRTNSLMIDMELPFSIGEGELRYRTLIDIPLMYLEADPRDPDNEGKTVQQKLKYKHLVVGDPRWYPVGIMTVDRAEDY